MAFTITNPDTTLSPLSGMTRRHWIESGRYLLEGVFQHIINPDDPILLPQQSEIIYPRPDHPSWRWKSAEFEGLSRTFMLAAPLINIDPHLQAGGHSLRDYYANQILLATDPASPRYLQTFSELMAQYGTRNYQHTVECGALCVGLMACREQIWQHYSKPEKDRVARFLSDFAHLRTVAVNWRFFNVLMLTFLKLHGYKIDEVILRDHLMHLLALYTGDGWYRDNNTFDFYIPWAFHFYAPIWCSWYGYEHEPEMAAAFEQRNALFMQTYPNFFSRQGHQLMWGRSIIYRCAASAAFGAAFLLKKTSIDAGLARRIASGNLIQFLEREDVYHQGVPCIGFYGPFDPLVQPYSCAASPFWLSKIYVALSLPENSPYWTARESNGAWDTIGSQTQSVTLPGPGITAALHGTTGAAEIYPGKVAKNFPYYNRLAFNTAFPWETDADDGPTAMQYSMRRPDGDPQYTVPERIGFIGQGEGITFRHVDIGLYYYGLSRIDAAEILLPGGMLRVDRLRIGSRHDLYLGNYGLPHIDDQAAVVRQCTLDGAAGITASIPGRRLALVALNGWDDVGAVTHEGRNAEATQSTVPYAHRLRETDYSGMEVLVTLLLHRCDDGEWVKDELTPVTSMEIVPVMPSGQPCGVRLALRDGRSFEIDFPDPEGSIAV